MYTKEAPPPATDWLTVAAYPHKAPPPRRAPRPIAAAPHLRRAALERAEAARRQVKTAANTYIPPDPADTVALLLTVLVGLCAWVAGIALVLGA